MKFSPRLPKKALSSYLSLGGLALALFVSWIYLSPPFDDQEQLHSLLQDRFQNLVSDYAIKKYPELREIVFHKIWTKNTPDPDSIKIFFSCSLKLEGEAAGTLLTEGQALLQRSPNRESFWIVRNFKIKNSELEFSEPLLIKASAPKK